MIDQSQNTSKFFELNNIICKSFRTSVHSCDLFLLIFTIILLIILIPPACAISVSDDQRKSIHEADLSTELSSDTSFLDNHFLIKVKSSSMKYMKKSPRPEDTGIISLNDLNSKHGVSTFNQVAKKRDFSNNEKPIFRWYKVTLKTQGKKITTTSQEFSRLNEIMDSYRKDANIEAVEQDYLEKVQVIPDDRYYSTNGSWNQSYPDLWGIHKISSISAWNYTTGCSSIIVADIDTGVDRNHEDLSGNMWVNTKEIPDNQIDDDMNGYVDDYYGWDWVNNDNDPTDDHGHGTHTAGTIAAVGNNGIGVVGVNWNSKIMALKFLNSGGSGYLSDAVKALQYAADNGANVSSNSWGSSGTSAMLDDAIQYAHDRGMVTVVAAGNSNTDALDFSPASSDMAITVAASDYNDMKASFSNWGEKIDVAAPGVNILSTRASINPMCTASRTVDANYCVVSGTSMATPHVAGLSALILAKNPSLTTEEVRQIIRSCAYDLGLSGKDRDFGYGRIDAYGSLSLADTQPLAPIITFPISRTVVYGQSLEIKGGVPGPDFDFYTIEAGAGRYPEVWIPIVNSSTQVINGTLATVDTTQLADGLYIFRLTAFDSNGKSYQFQVHDVEVDNFDAEIVTPVTLVSQGGVDVLGSAQTKNGLSFDRYTLEWGAGESPSTYSTAGISLINSGLQPASESKLATWDTSSLTADQVYTLRLTVKAKNVAVTRYLSTVKLDKHLVKGWPKLISRSAGCGICEATPTIADLDNDGVKEVVITSPDNKIYVFRKDGSNFPGFPVSVMTGEFFTWPANVDDLDNDGYKEIIAASVTPQGQSKVYIIRSDSLFFPGWPNPVHVIAQQAGDGTPSVADLDNDSNKEMVVIDPYYKKMHAYRINGSEITGFPKVLNFTDIEYPGAPSIVDIDNDGKLEIAYGLKNKFYLFDQNGDIMAGWPYIAPLYKGAMINFESSPASGDIDGDGELEILAIGHDGITSTPIYAWKKDGYLLNGWPMDAGTLSYSHSPMNSPSVVDIDGDGNDEVVVGLSSLSIFDMEGEKSIEKTIGAKIAPSISDIDGDGRYEFSCIRDNKIQIGNDDGSLAWERTFSTDAHFLSPAIVSDMDGNQKIEIGVVQGKFSGDGGDLVAYLWEMQNISAYTANDWPMFLHDPNRSGRIESLFGHSDIISPIISINNPINDTTVDGIIEVKVDASDNTGISKVELYRNNMLVDTDTSNPFIFSWDTTQEQNGIYTLQSKAYDIADNVGVSQDITVTVNNQVDPGDAIAPAVMITYPQNNSYVSKKSSVTIEAIASDNIGVTKVEFMVNGILICTDTTTSNTCDWKVPPRSGVRYGIQAQAYDAKGNVGYSSISEIISN